MADKIAAPRFFDIDGKPIKDVFGWMALMENPAYQQIQLFENDRLCISTVWLGLDLNPGTRPRIFETMIHVDSKYNSTWRWHTLEEAIDGHAALVECYQQTSVIFSSAMAAGVAAAVYEKHRRGNG